MWQSTYYIFKKFFRIFSKISTNFIQNLLKIFNFFLQKCVKILFASLKPFPLLPLKIKREKDEWEVCEG